MPTDNDPQSTVKHWQECTDAYDFLEQIRLRPGMWLPDGSLLHLQSILNGYQAALGVHSIGEPFDFWPDGHFSQWLRQHHGISSSLGWAAEIERNTPDGSTPVEEFFRLLGEYRRHAALKPAPNTPMSRFPGIEYMGNTFVTLFWRQRLLNQAVQHLEDRDFRVVRLAAGQWSTEQNRTCTVPSLPPCSSPTTTATTLTHSTTASAMWPATAVTAIQRKARDWSSPSPTTTDSQLPAPGRRKSYSTSSPIEPVARPYFSAG